VLSYELGNNLYYYYYLYTIPRGFESLSTFVVVTGFVTALSRLWPIELLLSAASAACLLRIRLGSRGGLCMRSLAPDLAVACCAHSLYKRPHLSFVPAFFCLRPPCLPLSSLFSVPRLIFRLDLRSEIFLASRFIRCWCSILFTRPLYEPVLRAAAGRLLLLRPCHVRARSTTAPRRQGSRPPVDAPRCRTPLGASIYAARSLNPRRGEPQSVTSQQRTSPRASTAANASTGGARSNMRIIQVQDLRRPTSVQGQGRASLQVQQAGPQHEPRPGRGGARAGWHRRDGHNLHRRGRRGGRLGLRRGRARRRPCTRWSRWAWSSSSSASATAPGSTARCRRRSRRAWVSSKLSTGRTMRCSRPRRSSALHCAGSRGVAVRRRCTASSSLP
jgi:hypothetical protein